MSRVYLENENAHAPTEPSVCRLCSCRWAECAAAAAKARNLQLRPGPQADSCAARAGGPDGGVLGPVPLLRVRAGQRVRVKGSAWACAAHLLSRQSTRK